MNSTAREWTSFFRFDKLDRRVSEQESESYKGKRRIERVSEW